jgi:hypothetical protein
LGVGGGGGGGGGAAIYKDWGERTLGLSLLESSQVNVVLNGAFGNP